MQVAALEMELDPDMNPQADVEENNQSQRDRIIQAEFEVPAAFDPAVEQVEVES